MTHAARCAVAGALALDLRGAWNDSKWRHQALVRLLEEAGEYALAQEAATWDRDDGRWFRDCWSGPYGGCTRAELAAAGETEDLFAYPEYVIANDDE